MRVDVLDAIAMIGTAHGQDVEFFGSWSESEGASCASEPKEICCKEPRTDGSANEGVMASCLLVLPW